MRKIFLLLFTVMSCLAINATTKTVTFNLYGNWDELEADGTWSNQYLARSITIDDVTVSFKRASRQTSTITTCPVTKGDSIFVTIADENAVITNATIDLEQWKTKTQTVRINTSTDGVNYTQVSGASSYDFEPFSTDFSADDAVKAVAFTFSSQSNQVGVTSIAVTYEVADSAPETNGFNVTPAAGDVETLSEIVLTYENGSFISPSCSDEHPITITDAEGNIIQAFGPDYMNKDGVVNNAWEPTAITLTLDTPITTPGTYMLNIPNSSFYVGDDYESCEETTFTWNVLGGTVAPRLVKSVVATYTDYTYDGTTYANYNDTDWGMVEGAKFTVDIYENDSLVIRNWMNQNVDLCVKYDSATGDVITVNNPDGTPSYWAYADNSYWAYVSNKEYYNMSFVDIANEEIFLYISWGTAWEGYHLSWAPAPVKFTSEPADGDKVSEIAKVTFTFPDIKCATYNMSTQPSITNENGESASFGYYTWGEEENQIVVMCDPIVTYGVYTITLPAGSITLDSVTTTKDISIQLGIGTFVGIDAINSDEQTVTFNLAGQRVNATVKGINIQNGKKFIAK